MKTYNVAKKDNVINESITRKDATVIINLVMLKISKRHCPFC